MNIDTLPVLPILYSFATLGWIAAAWAFSKSIPLKVYKDNLDNTRRILDKNQETLLEAVKICKDTETLLWKEKSDAIVWRHVADAFANGIQSSQRKGEFLPTVEVLAALSFYQETREKRELSQNN
jgi:hypothetical protein